MLLPSHDLLGSGLRAEDSPVGINHLPGIFPEANTFLSHIN